MTKVIPSQWIIDGFNGGEGDGFYQGPDNSYRAGKNIETRQVENALLITNKLTDTGQTFTGTFGAVNPFEPRSFSTYYSSVGYLYRNGTLATVVSTGTTAYNQILGWGKMERGADNITYNYGFTATNSGSGRIQRVDPGFGGVTYNIGTSRTLGGGRTGNPLYKRVFTLSLGDRIVFAYANTIFEIDQTETITKLLELPKQADVMGLSYFQDTYKIFYNVENSTGGQANSYIAYWDGLSNAVDQKVEYLNSPIRVVINNGAYDYVVFGDNITADLYEVGGLDRGAPIRGNIENSFNNNSRGFGLIGGIREGILYLSGTNKFNEDCLYSFGNYYPGTPRQLVPENLSPFINGIGVKNQYLEIYADNKIYTKNFLFNQTPESQGICIPYPLTGNYGYHTKKTLKSLYLGYQIYNSSDTIKVYLKKNGGVYSTNTTGWTLVATTPADITKRGLRIDRTSILSLNLGDFYQLEMKIEINASSSRSPAVFNTIVFYDDNLED